jgi:hypothetical protein
VEWRLAELIDKLRRDPEGKLLQDGTVLWRSGHRATQVEGFMADLP